MSHVPFNQRAFLKGCRHYLKQGQDERLLTELRDALARNLLDAAGVTRAGRMLEHMNRPATLKVALLGQVTTSFLSPMLSALAARDGEFLSVAAEPYDSVMQSLLTLQADLDVIIMLPWQQRVLAPGTRTAEERVEDELRFWQQAWQLVGENSNARIVQVGYDWLDAGAAGPFHSGQPGGDVRLIRELNRRLADGLPASAYYVDLGQVAGEVGRRHFYDARNYYWARQPLTEQGALELCRHLWAGIRATVRGPKKVLVLDLDNTLWGGVVGETGSQGIELGGTPTGEAFADFQRLVKQLGKRGCVLAVCSKNDEADARAPFVENADMVLQLSDFAAFKAGWGPKSDGIREIATELRLGPDSFVFFDDSKAEQEEVRSALPDVAVVDVPADPSDFRRALLDGLWFETVRLTTEDRQRAQHYQHERRRQRSQAEFRSMAHYLSSLQMVAEAQDLGADDLDRVAQLLGKTNQFNLTTRRHSREDVRRMLAGPGAVGLTIRLADKFGDYGLVSVILAVTDKRDASTLVIDSWLMSCRAIARTLEHAFFNYLLDRARQLGYRRLVGEYVPTSKNSLVENHYAGLGFDAVQTPANGTGRWYELDLSRAEPAVTHVSVAQRAVRGGNTSNAERRSNGARSTLS